MGLRKDLDTKHCLRYIYYLLHNDVVIYVGTSENPKNRFKQHLISSQKNNNALIYKYIRSVNFDVKMKVVDKTFGNYEIAESLEIKHIEKNAKTTLNFYNNPNKENYYKQIELLK